ncbi:MAG: RluA family pseudouridine synthase [Gammaproteobacteria bacterium]|nr:RluA family pseudouridine synthase [Gammaproteobacteria bacterium]NNC98407.1 RluA family pseudouridine synthase [Gammaproteobacteria bacterium]NNM13882.1 RluA family pseudouridine synthase [Gammaproteobacteria bacterium]
MTEQKSSTGLKPSNLFTVADDEAGQRLDNYLLREFKDLPRSHLYRLVRTGQVRINKKRCKPMQKLSAGDQIRLPPKMVLERQENLEAKPQLSLGSKLAERLQNSILFEDERLLIIDKPSGMAVHGGSGISLGVIEAMRLLKPQQQYLELVHRLDRSTSGCLVLAKKRSALRELHRQIRDNEVKKQYLTLLKDHWSDRARVDLPLDVEHRKGGERHVVVSEKGKKSLSHFNRLQHYIAEKNKNLKVSLMQVDLETGRTHQIRVHAQAKQHPVAGDDRYGDREFNKQLKKLGLKRLFLHAHNIEFTHPKSGEELSISAPLPDDLSRLIDKLKPV